MKDENPLDLEQHEDETPWDVWKRRLIFGLLILLCVTFAAPTFSSCTGAFEGGDRVATYRLGDTTYEVGDVEFRDVQRRLSQAYYVLYQQAPSGDDAYWQHVPAPHACDEIDTFHNGSPSGHRGDMDPGTVRRSNRRTN